MNGSVRLSFRPSVCLPVTPFLLCSHHRIIMKFYQVITNDRNNVHAKGQGKMSKVKVTEVKTQLSRFQTETPLWIHICWWNDAQSLVLLSKSALWFFKVIHQISRAHGYTIVDFDTNCAFPDCNFSLNSVMAMKWCIKLKVEKKRRPIVFQGHLSYFKITRDKKLPILTRIECLRTVNPV